MKTTKRIAILAAAMTAAPLISTGVASASTSSCDSGDICIYQNDGLGGGLYATVNLNLSHTNLFFTNGAPVRDRANSVRNRTSCRIRVIDDRGIYPDDWQDINGQSWANLISSVDNENDRHERRC